jgi:hypothetical protein
MDWVVSTSRNMMLDIMSGSDGFSAETILKCFPRVVKVGLWRLQIDWDRC